MKRTVSILLILTMMFGIASCATEKTLESFRTRSNEKEIIESSEEDDVDIDELDENVEVDINELKKLDGVMFSGNNSNCWMIIENMDTWINTEFVLYYDGTLEMTVNRNLTGSITQSTQISDIDYMSIYDFAYDGYINETYKDYCEYVDDGAMWAFYFYDSDKSTHVVYSGYAYSNEAMCDIEDILYSYEEQFDFSYALPDEGIMLDAVVSYWEPIDWSTDNVCGEKYVVNYDKTLDYYYLYTISEPELIKTVEVSDYDFQQILEFCLWSKKDNPFKDYSEDNVCDGETWAFTYYDEESAPFLIYDGYTYSNYDLYSFTDILEQIVE